MNAERWVVTGTDKYGEIFTYPNQDRADVAPTKEEADDTVIRMNRRGGNVKAHKEVWSGPKAAYVKVD